MSEAVHKLYWAADALSLVIVSHDELGIPLFKHHTFSEQLYEWNPVVYQDQVLKLICELHLRVDTVSHYVEARVMKDKRVHDIKEKISLPLSTYSLSVAVVAVAAKVGRFYHPALDDVHEGYAKFLTDLAEKRSS